MYYMIGALAAIVVSAAFWYSVATYKPDKYYVLYSYKGSEMCILNSRRGAVTYKEAKQLCEGLKEEGYHVKVVKEA